MARSDVVRAGLGVALLAALSCGGSTATVSGRVTFRDQPLPSGTVLFHGADGRVEHALIADGRYTVPDVPLGAVRITVQTHAAMPTHLPSRGDKAPKAPKEAAPPSEDKRDGKYLRIPTRYGAPDTSGLSLTVRHGRQTHDIDLKP